MVEGITQTLCGCTPCTVMWDPKLPAPQVLGSRDEGSTWFMGLLRAQMLLKCVDV